jgi:hypothetical protein
MTYLEQKNFGPLLSQTSPNPAGTKLCQRMYSQPRIFSKIFLGFPGPPQTRYTPSFFIFKKKLKFDGG